MNKLVFCIVFLCVSINLNAQKSSYKFHGIWKGIISSDPNSNITYYDIIMGNKALMLTLDSNKIVSFGQSIVGFVDIKQDTINRVELKEEGKYFCFCEETINKKLVCQYADFNYTDSTFYTYGTDVFDYNKTTELLPNIIKLLYSQGKKDHQNYFKEFLDKTVTEITTSKVSICTAPAFFSKVYLLRGNMVEVLETKDIWIKIRYYGNKTIEGWIKKSDVE